MKFFPVFFVLPTITAFSAISPESPKQEKVPWEFGRFVKQSSKFVTLPNPFQTTSPAAADKIRPGELLWTPASSIFSFGPLDDVIMGGASSSSFDQETGVWKGTVTDANSGGFIGMRSFPSVQWNMEGCNGIEMKIKGGQGKRFKFVLRDSTEFNGVCWTSSIDVGEPSFMDFFKGKEEEGVSTVRIPFDKQVPTIRGETIPDVTFNEQSVVAVQVVLSKFEYDGELNPKFAVGDLELQIKEIKAY